MTANRSNQRRGEEEDKGEKRTNVRGGWEEAQLSLGLETGRHNDEAEGEEGG